MVTPSGTGDNQRGLDKAGVGGGKEKSYINMVIPPIADP
jgi:hypothetical protein